MPGLNAPFATAVLAAVTTLTPIAQQPPSTQGPTFRSGTQVVSLFVTVQDAQKRLMPRLTQSDFEVFDNDKPQPITYFDNSVHPITCVTMLDTSGSMTLTIDPRRQPAERFGIRLLRAHKDRDGAVEDRL